MEVLGDKAKSMVVAQTTYEVTDAAIDSQILTLKNSGADTFINITSPKFAALAIRKVGEIGWKPTQYLANVSSSVVSVLKPAGLDNATGIMTAAYLRDPSDPQWKNTKEFADYMEWNKKYFPGGDAMEAGVVTGYSMAQTLVQTLKQAGDNLTRENIMKQAASLEMNLPMLYPGIRLKTGPDDFYPLESSQMLRFNGTGWETVGGIIGDR
jgi:ABC-type branched-subunit amino acid transport system substrate-binding protein